MTQEEKTVKIAEACGWTEISKKGMDAGGYSVTTLCGIKSPLRGWMPIPDYFNDLNAMHEAEKTLTDDEHRLFRALLFVEAYNEPPGVKTNDQAERERVSATASRRAEMFGQVKKLWERE